MEAAQQGHGVHPATGQLATEHLPGARGGRRGNKASHRAPGNSWQQRHRAWKEGLLHASRAGHQASPAFASRAAPAAGTHPHMTIKRSRKGKDPPPKGMCPARKHRRRGRAPLPGAAPLAQCGAACPSEAWPCGQGAGGQRERSAGVGWAAARQCTAHAACAACTACAAPYTLAMHAPCCKQQSVHCTRPDGPPPHMPRLAAALAARQAWCSELRSLAANGLALPPPLTVVPMLVPVHSATLAPLSSP